MTKKSIALTTKIIIWTTFALAGFGCHFPGNLQSETDKRSQIATMYQKYTREFPQVEGITVRELQNLQKQNQSIVLVDVRSPEERKISIIPGAISADLFERKLEEYTQDNQLVIAYCTIGYRSGKYAAQLRQQGINILNLEGSLLAWSHIQGKLADARGMTNKVHVFGRQWQLTADNYEPVW